MRPIDRKRPTLMAAALAVATAVALALVSVLVDNNSENQQSISGAKPTSWSQRLRRTGDIRKRKLWTQPEDIGEIPIEGRDTIDPNLIDFVVAGFQKCGTTYLQNKILYPSKRLFIPHSETHYLQNDKYTEFVEEFENITAVSTDADGEQKAFVIGYKSPFELGHEKSLRNLETLFPDVRMVITLRHPILQFESLYNYKLRTLPDLIPTVDHYVGLCGELCPTWREKTDFDNREDFMKFLEGSAEKSNKNRQQTKCVEDKLTFCTGESNYHQYLSRLGLTPMNTPEEIELLDYHTMPIHDFSDRKLFLIEIGQFDNRVNQTMADDLITDLESFLRLDVGDLPRIPHRNGDHRPKKEYEYPEGRKGQVLEICLDKYKPLREVLMETSRRASQWITQFLLHPSNLRNEKVVVSNVNMFIDMVEQWKIDPCEDENEDQDT